jgi:hypothetical protein
MGLPFTRRKPSSTTLKKKEKNISSTGFCFSAFFTDRASHLLLPKVVLKNKKKKEYESQYRV